MGHWDNFTISTHAILSLLLNDEEGLVSGEKRALFTTIVQRIYAVSHINDLRS